MRHQVGLESATIDPERLDSQVFSEVFEAQ